MRAGRKGDRYGWKLRTEKALEKALDMGKAEIMEILETSVVFFGHWSLGFGLSFVLSVCLEMDRRGLRGKTGTCPATHVIAEYASMVD